MKGKVIMSGKEGKGENTHLEREIKRMLHLLRPEDNFPSANQEKAAVTQIGDVKSRVVEEGEEAC